MCLTTRARATAQMPMLGAPVYNAALWLQAALGQLRMPAASSLEGLLLLQLKQHCPVQASPLADADQILRCSHTR